MMTIDWIDACIDCLMNIFIIFVYAKNKKKQEIIISHKNLA